MILPASVARVTLHGVNDTVFAFLHNAYMVGFSVAFPIKKARTAKGMTRDELSRIVDYDPRHLQAIENEGQKPSLELFIQLVTMFGVSVDEYIFPDNEVKKSSVRRRLDAELDKLNDKELLVIEATVSGLCKAKEPEE